MKTSFNAVLAHICISTPEFCLPSCSVMCFACGGRQESFRMWQISVSSDTVIDGEGLLM